MSVPGTGHDPIPTGVGAEMAPPPAPAAHTKAANTHVQKNAEGATIIRSSSVGRHDLVDYSIPKDVRENYERMLESVIGDMQRYMNSGKKDIPEEMKELVAMFSDKARREELLNTG